MSKRFSTSWPVLDAASKLVTVLCLMGMSTLFGALLAIGFLSSHHLQQTEKVVEGISEMTRKQAGAAMATAVGYALSRGDVAGAETAPDGAITVHLNNGGPIVLANPWGGPQRFDAATGIWYLEVPERACPSLVSMMPQGMLAGVGTGGDLDGIGTISARPGSIEETLERCAGAHALALRFAGPA
ncbi:hypothetical protein Sp245p_31420 (plasmid) [Azospirillum baldaniorum]|uniref:Uncharacterized protein n=1 Tax=Azospirillum baldaniorum TaxID=1064539 RepID=A0A9P1NS56_9PROT|nr:hypothetical protein [Azospirillum baldaniorum]AWJ94367.1 hypothetical protein Sp245p_31420 [Azospirillum baldaniorum]TWA70420.1 hypothetical protein FBZ85_12339 [Azospirillum brasilense]CCD03821.1 exported protein of unknown function [Azospirillum baldaniorum]